MRRMNMKTIIGISFAGAFVLTLIIGAIMFFGVLAPTKMLAASSDNMMLMDMTESTQSYRASGAMPMAPSEAIDVAKAGDAGSTSGAMPATMIFMNYGTNIFEDPSNDALSTFSLDVDTGAYTISKNYIMNGKLPPTDAIRPEEFINYFDYNYQALESEFSITAEAAPSPFSDNPDTTLLRIGLKAREVEQRDPVKITFVIDVSGSMNTDNRIALLKKSLNFLVDELNEDDQIAIVKYNYASTKVLDFTPVSEKESIKSAIDSLIPGGGTNVEQGLTLGYQIASQDLNDEYINKVLLFSDGVANIGLTDPNSIAQKFDSYKQQGITFLAIGVGLGNYNDELMEQIADKADGQYAYINDFDEAQRVFSKNLMGTLVTVAKDAKIQVEFNEDVVSRYRLIGYENRQIADAAFRDDEQDAGEIGAGHEVTAIYELELKEPGTLGTVSFRYKQPDSSTAEEYAVTLNEGIINDNFESASESFRFAVAVARFAQILKMTAPPPSISEANTILESINAKDVQEEDFRIVFSNTQRLIELKMEETR